MARIVFISPYYPPEQGAAAVCVSENAIRLAKRGHNVTVLTTMPNYPTGIVPPAYRGHRILRETLDGVEVVRVWSYASPNKGFWRRILAHTSFGFMAPLLGAGAVGQPDIIIVQSPPLFDAVAVRLLSWRKHCPYIYMVSDLWPASAVQLGALRNRLLIRLSEWLEWSTYQRAGKVWVVTAGMWKDLRRRGLAADRMFLITNGVDTKKFRPLPQRQARAELGWNDYFTAIYAGTHGLSHGLMTVLAAAELLLARRDIRFVLVGNGAEKAKLMAEAARRNLTNVTFLDSQPHERVPTLLAAADVCLVHLRSIPLFEGALPIKMYEAMACARPILLAVDGEARQLATEEYGAAVYVEPENAAALASAIISLQEQPERARELGQRGRALVQERFDYDLLVAALDKQILSLLGKDQAAADVEPDRMVNASTEAR
ncbi:MAG TPA: glycosyltransferase family 4 protein [Ktedonobacteraceae bacterium]|nr:glycosyltransferase family 4 protein [Ktedonobacteraceae bacterium]